MSFSPTSAFSNASNSYNRNAGLQEQAADWLCEVVSDATTVLDVGCGTGMLAQRLRSRVDRLLGLDMAWGMLQQARPWYEQCLCADMGRVPLAANSVDAAVSNLAIQWVASPESALAEMGRVLKPGGQLVLTVPLPGSLVELERSWRQQGDVHRHINQFDSLLDWQRRVQAVFGMAVDAQLEQQRFVRWFDTPSLAVRSLKGVGANRVTQGARAGLTGKQAYADMLKNYESLRCAEGIPLTYEILRLKIAL